MSESKREPLRRSIDDRILAGICGGLGEFFGVNPLWFRLGFLISALPGGFPGIPLYLVLWIIIPKA